MHPKCDRPGCSNDLRENRIVLKDGSRFCSEVCELRHRFQVELDKIVDEFETRFSRLEKKERIRNDQFFEQADISEEVRRHLEGMASHALNGDQLMLLDQLRKNRELQDKLDGLKEHLHQQDLVLNRVRGERNTARGDLRRMEDRCDTLERQLRNYQDGDTDPRLQAERYRASMLKQQLVSRIFQTAFARLIEKYVGVTRETGISSTHEECQRVWAKFVNPKRKALPEWVNRHMVDVADD